MKSVKKIESLSSITEVPFNTVNVKETGKILFKITGNKELKTSYIKNQKRKIKHKGEAEALWIAKKLKIPFVYIEGGLSTKAKALGILHSNIMTFCTKNS